MARRRKPISWQAFHLPKHGHTAEEYEDAFAANGGSRRFAVADGASESSYALLWARELVVGFVNLDVKAASNPNWVQPLQRRWAEAVDAFPLPWYAEAKREQGAFATFLGLQLQRRGLDRGTWRCLAVGDSCLFQIRADQVIAAFPLTRSDEFDNLPGLIGSRMAAVAPWKKRQGRWRAGDRFLLMTDALGQWFLRQRERVHKPEAPAKGSSLAGASGLYGGCDCIMNVMTADQAAFAAWISDLRGRGELRNDDVTLIDIRL